MRVLLDRDEVGKVVERVTNEAVEKKQHKWTIQRSIIYELGCLTPVEAEPVRHGRWIYGETEGGTEGIFCSECDHFVPHDYDFYADFADFISDNPRCPGCGARMDGESE